MAVPAATGHLFFGDPSPGGCCGPLPLGRAPRAPPTPAPAPTPTSFLTVRSSLCRVSASVGRDGGAAGQASAGGGGPGLPSRRPRAPRPLTRGARGHGRARCVPGPGGGGACSPAPQLQPRRGGAERPMTSGPAAQPPRPSGEPPPPRSREPGGREGPLGGTHARVPAPPAPPPLRAAPPPTPSAPGPTSPLLGSWAGQSCIIYSRSAPCQAAGRGGRLWGLRLTLSKRQCSHL